MLALRKNSGTVTGDILINGRRATRTEFGRIAGFAEQQDVHMPTATVSRSFMPASRCAMTYAASTLLLHYTVQVREAIAFSAALRLGARASLQRITEVVSCTLHVLRLEPIANPLVSVLSASELKLLTIGVELAGCPSILFLDEPTVNLREWCKGHVCLLLHSVNQSVHTRVVNLTYEKHWCQYYCRRVLMHDHRQLSSQRYAQ